MQKYLKYISLVFFIVTTVVLIPLKQTLLGWLLLGVTVVLLLLCEKHFKQDMLVIVTSLGLLGITPINTDISFLHIFQMGTTLFLAIALPFIITRFYFKEKTIQYPFHHGKRWYKREIFSIFVIAMSAYLLLPFYLNNTGAYHNWTVKPGVLHLITLFLTTNGLGTWDEFFFVSTVLAILKKHFTFSLSNASQAVIFTSFLFELGFRGWAPCMLYPFALTQGYIFNKTHSLLYVITIHLTLDLILYLALIHAYYPQWVRIFIT